MEEQIKAEMRMTALETLVIMLCAAQHEATGDPQASLKRLSSKVRARLQNLTLPGLDPVYSDLAAAELEAAIETLIRGQRQLLGEPSQEDRTQFS